MPAEYRPFTGKAPRKLTANQAFINNPDLQREYQNRSYASVQKKEKVEEQIRFTQEAPVSVTCVPPRAPLREVVPVRQEEEQYRPPQLESLLAMIQETKRDLVHE